MIGVQDMTWKSKHNTFLELTEQCEDNKNQNKILLNMNTITWIRKKTDITTEIKTEYAIILVKEPYEEVKQTLIKGA